MGEQADGADAGTAPSKWRRLGVLVAVPSLVVAGAVSYYLPGILHGAGKRVVGPQAPLTVEVRTDIDQFDYSGVAHVPEFVVTSPVEGLGAPPNPKLQRTVNVTSDMNQRGRWEWAHQHGAVDGNETLLRVTIQGRQAAPVTLQGLQVEVVARRPPMAGSLLSYYGLGSSVSPDTINVDLDADPPVVTYVDAAKSERRSFTFEVSNTDIQVLNILTTTGTCDCSWIAKLQYTSAGKAGEVILDDHGVPFRTTATKNSQHCYWDGAAWVCLR